MRYIPTILSLVLIAAGTLFCGCATQKRADSQESASESRELAKPADPHLAAEGDLQGRYFLGGPIAEGDLNSGESHFYVWLEGEAASSLYEALPGTASKHICEDGHAFSKSKDSIFCTTDADSTSHRCYFAINIPASTIENGYSC